MMKVDNPAEFNDAFGELNLEQIKVLIKLLKHARGRCRNNAALRNWLTMMFPKFSFSEIYREYNGESYKTLDIKERTL